MLVVVVFVVVAHVVAVEVGATGGGNNSCGRGVSFKILWNWSS